MTSVAIGSEAVALSWVALALTPGLGPTRARKLAEHFGSAESVFRASLTELEACGLHTAAAQAIGTGKSAELAQEELKKVADAGARVITLDDSAYPPLLRQIYDPPVALYVRGNADVLSAPGIAVIGTRHPTPYGVGMAERLSCDLAGNLGLVITSGMARGVDTAAHRGALIGKGKTVAVFGTGIDVIYPRENQKIADSVLATGGALVSEFAIGTFAAPQRNLRGAVLGGRLRKAKVLVAQKCVYISYNDIYFTFSSANPSSLPVRGNKNRVDFQWR
jgi:DNA processing protein